MAESEVRCSGSWRQAVRQYVGDGRVIACPECGRTFPELDADKPGAPLPEHGVEVPEQCEHGLSAWLCEGPQHYPFDRDDPRGW